VRGKQKREKTKKGEREKAKKGVVALFFVVIIKLKV
jgi:hypothetical protein